MKNQILLYVSLVFLGLFVYSSIIDPVLDDFMPLQNIPGGIGSKTIFMLFFSLFHSWYVLGWKNTLVFFALTSAVSWGYEQAGVETGLIYGNYQYTDALGEKLGHVPIIIPLAWFMMIYPSYIIANLIATKNLTVHYSGISMVVWLAVVSALVMTSWDVVIDPYLSGPTQQAWIWEDGGEYFDVPLHNFAGWLLTTFTIYFLYRLFEYRRGWTLKKSLGNFAVVIPVAAFGLMLIANIIPGEPPELRIIGPIVMGVPIVFALIRLKQKIKSQEDLSLAK